jgi:hypothetical protein
MTSNLRIQYHFKMQHAGYDRTMEDKNTLFEEQLLLFVVVVAVVVVVVFYGT